MSGKRKGGAEKSREKKRLLLLNASDKCFKLKDMFSKTSKLSSMPNTSKSDTNAVGQSNDRIGKFYPLTY